ncbi:GvpL/GvpF family gas vesicle protein [Micromonospora sp. CPCC 206060]|uniref:GvpL/GvpF family gas vesicle protein n=1 Tax=Micromonospora sp. CPCC 206060 TaxID=3122406 RepID=UPI002FEF3C59
MAVGTGLFVYGIVPADVEPTPDASGVGDPPGVVEVVRHDELAALVSEVVLEEPVGRPADLTAYKELLDGTATVAPVLPVRFGTVVTGPDAVTDLLQARHDRFLELLREFEGRVEYVVHGRYIERELLVRILAEQPAAADLARQVHGQPERTIRNQRIRLGEMISQAVEARREADTRELVERLAPLSVANQVRPPSHEQDAAHAAFLVDAGRDAEFTEAAEAVAERWQGGVRLRLLGPLAPYDFVDSQQLAA